VVQKSLNNDDGVSGNDVVSSLGDEVLSEEHTASTPSPLCLDDDNG